MFCKNQKRKTRQWTKKIENSASLTQKTLFKTVKSFTSIVRFKRIILILLYVGKEMCYRANLYQVLHTYNLVSTLKRSVGKGEEREK